MKLNYTCNLVPRLLAMEVADMNKRDLCVLRVVMPANRFRVNQL